MFTRPKSRNFSSNQSDYKNNNYANANPNAVAAASAIGIAMRNNSLNQTGNTFDQHNFSRTNSMQSKNISRSNSIAYNLKTPKSARLGSFSGFSDHRTSYFHEDYDNETQHSNSALKSIASTKKSQTKMVKKYIPTPNGIKIVEVPAEQLKQDIAKNNSLFYKSRNQHSVPRSASLTSFSNGNRKSFRNNSLSSIQLKSPVSNSKNSATDVIQEEELEVNEIDKQILEQKLILQKLNQEKIKLAKEIELEKKLSESLKNKREISEKQFENEQRMNKKEEVRFLDQTEIIDEAKSNLHKQDQLQNLSPNKLEFVTQYTSADSLATALENSNDHSPIMSAKSEATPLTSADNDVVNNKSIENFRSANLPSSEISDSGLAKNSETNLELEGERFSTPLATTENLIEKASSMEQEFPKEVQAFHPNSESENFESPTSPLANTEKLNGDERLDSQAYYPIILAVDGPEYESGKSMANHLRPTLNLNDERLNEESLQLPVSINDGYASSSSEVSSISRSKPKKSALKISPSRTSVNSPQVNGPAQQAYLSLATAENTRLNSKISPDGSVSQNSQNTKVKAPDFQRSLRPQSVHADRPINKTSTQPAKGMANRSFRSSSYYPPPHPIESPGYQSPSKLKAAKLYEKANQRSSTYQRPVLNKKSSFEKESRPNDGAPFSRLSLREPIEASNYTNGNFGPSAINNHKDDVDISSVHADSAANPDKYASTINRGPADNNANGDASSSHYSNNATSPQKNFTGSETSSPRNYNGFKSFNQNNKIDGPTQNKIIDTGINNETIHENPQSFEQNGNGNGDGFVSDNGTSNVLGTNENRFFKSAKYEQNEEEPISNVRQFFLGKKPRNTDKHLGTKQKHNRENVTKIEKVEIPENFDHALKVEKAEKVEKSNAEKKKFSKLKKLFGKPHPAKEH